jgi:hypothetical protein
VTFVYDRVVAGLPERLTPIQQDWLDILGALFAADLTCLRGDERDWTRDIEIWIGVRQPDHWRPLTDHFRRVFGALTYDSIRINFETGAFHRPPPRQRSRVQDAYGGGAAVRRAGQSCRWRPAGGRR